MCRLDRDDRVALVVRLTNGVAHVGGVDGQCRQTFAAAHRLDLESHRASRPVTSW
jgi:hypothetical protein